MFTSYNFFLDNCINTFLPAKRDFYLTTSKHIYYLRKNEESYNFPSLLIALDASFKPKQERVPVMRLVGAIPCPIPARNTRPPPVL